MPVLVEPRAGCGPEHHVVVREVDREAVETVSDRRACQAAGGEVGTEHEVVDEQLRASAEELGQGRAPLVRVEGVLPSG